MEEMRVLIDYLKSVVKEVQAVSFPTRQDVYTTSLSIFIIIIMAMIFISFADFVISSLIKLLLVTI